MKRSVSNERDIAVDIIGGDWGEDWGDATTSCCNGNWKMFDFGNFFISFRIDEGIEFLRDNCKLWQLELE